MLASSLPLHPNRNFFPLLYPGCAPVQQPALPEQGGSCLLGSFPFEPIATLTPSEGGNYVSKMNENWQWDIGSAEARGTLPLACPQRRGRERAGRSLGTQGQTGDTVGLTRGDLGFLCLGDRCIHKPIEKATFNSVSQIVHFPSQALQVFFLLPDFSS